MEILHSLASLVFLITSSVKHLLYRFLSALFLPNVTHTDQRQKFNDFFKLVFDMM